jgi:polar amino acid transport system substrate-binding protein
MRTRPRVALASVCCLGLALTGCGSNKKSVVAAPTVSAAPTGDASAQPTDTALPQVSADPTLAAAVPTALASSGTLTIGTDSTYAPNEFLAADGHTVEGFDVDLFNAVAAKLGLSTKYVSAPFTNIIPGVQSAKYDLGVSSFTINADRLKVADMVSYFSAGTQWATAAGNAAGVSLDDACGKRVAVQTGTV